MKEFEIWIGFYHLGQGYDPPTKPELLAKISAINFKVACLKYELTGKLKKIEDCEKTGEYLDEQSCRNFYNWDGNYNDWTGRYYQSYGAALELFTKK